MQILDLLNKANREYDDGFLANYFDKDTGAFNEDGTGDTLAEFVVRELSETIDPNAPDEEQLSTARGVIEEAIKDLGKVLLGLED